MKFGDILKDLLEERELTQKQMAEDLNISASAIGNYVRNNREPDFHTLKKIAAYFHVSTDFLLNYPVNEATTYQEQKILQIFRTLPEREKNLYIEQGRLLVQYYYKGDASSK